MNTIMSLVPVASSRTEGLKYQVYTNRFAKFFDLKNEKVVSLFPDKKEWIPYEKDLELSGYEGYFKELKQAKEFIAELRRGRPIN
jgi:hypothetical protein